MKLRIRKMHLSLFFFEHQYLTYYNILTSEMFYAYSQHSDLVNSFSDFFVGPSIHFKHKSFPVFCHKIQSRP